MEELSGYVKAFEAYLRSLNKSVHTIKQYTLDAAQFAKIIEQQQGIEDALKLYTKTIEDKYKSTNSINRKYAGVRQFLSFLQLRAVVPMYNPVLLQPKEKVDTKLLVLSEKQTRAALSYWPQKYAIAQNEDDHWLALRNATIVFIMAELGIKPAELVRMEWKHMQVNNQQLVVLAAKKHRILKLSEKLLEMLIHYKEMTAKFMLIAEDVPYVWLGIGNKKGHPVTVKTVERIFHAMSHDLTFKVTATNLRYQVIQKGLKESTDTEDLFEQFGYARKGVLVEREQRFPKGNI